MKLKKKKYSRKRELIEQIKRDKVCFAVYAILRLLVILSLVIALFRGNYENAALCVGTLLLLLAPAFVERRFKIELPTALEVVVMCFIFAHAILGEIACFYVRVPGWDTMLHTLNGFICAGVGLSLIDLLNRNQRFKFELSPVYVVIVAFCFSMTVGVLWEFFEFGSDMLLHSDMQKDTVVNRITSVMLDPTNSNKTVTVDGITDVTVNGEALGLGGYLDIGLIDTMKDLMVNFIGAVVFSVGGFFYLKYRGKKSRIIQGFVPTVTDPDETNPKEDAHHDAI
ncbi:MAG: hypothetical protein E7630_00785 [Ruminococcaceae bacterium]|nr:hypothetical protein [Oscillospiraceae bacterium]